MIDLFSLPLPHFLILCLAAMFVGMAKTGLSGFGMIAVPLMALVFGSKSSTGLMLPMLIIADVMAVSYYHRHAEWVHLRRLLPFAIIGAALGTLIGQLILDKTFTIIMAVIIFISVGIMIWQEKAHSARVPKSKWFAPCIGIAGGVTTMIGNLAGPVMALYLLAMRMPKKEFIGTAAWFFFTINLVKVPFHVFVWGTITVDSVLLNMSLIPAIAIGAWLGIKLVALLNETMFRNFVIAMTAIAAVVMLL